ncbi:hypothetical protein ASA1KI_21630 [Opitutales bacterium ASA1]|uniref:recombinase family protein n=1 Tax=Congregicoccus parvus TaxID=3081749 RepID=UPI002B3150AB|nr:hypothetical protein ASA1KI_21630 [Opitutales bacterium ASA1]
MSEREKVDLAIERVPVAIAARISVEERGKTQSIANQHEAARGYVANHVARGWYVEMEVADEGVSGDVPDRPGILKILAAVDSGRIKVVLFSCIDRLTRDVRIGLNFIDRLDARGVELHTVRDGRIDTKNPGQLMMLLVQLGMAQGELINIRGRIRTGVSISVAKGARAAGQAPFGYDCAPGSRTLVVNEVEAAIVREIFELAAGGWGSDKIASHLNDRGIRRKLRQVTRKDGQVHTVGGKQFDHASVRAILDDRTYCGLNRTRNFESAGQKPLFVDEQGFGYFRGSHTPIVSEELWSRASERSRRGARSVNLQYRKSKHGYLLAGLVRCATHNVALSPVYSGKRRKDGSLFRYYSCMRFMKLHRHSGCTLKSISADAAETAVLDFLAQLAASDELVEAVVEASKEPGRHAKLLGVQRDLQQETAKLRAKKANIVEVLCNGGVQGLSEELRQKVDEINATLASIETRIGGLRSEIAESATWDIPPDEVREALSSFSLLARALPVVDRQRLVQLLIKEILVARVGNSHGDPSDQFRLTIRMRVAALFHLRTVSDSSFEESCNIRADAEDGSVLTTQVTFRSSSHKDRRIVEFVSPVCGQVAVHSDAALRGTCANVTGEIHPALMKARDIKSRIGNGVSMTVVSEQMGITVASVSGYMRLFDLPAKVMRYLETERDSSVWKKLPLRLLIKIARLPANEALALFAEVTGR